MILGLSLRALKIFQPRYRTRIRGAARYSWKNPIALGLLPTGCRELEGCLQEMKWNNTYEKSHIERGDEAKNVKD